VTSKRAGRLYSFLKAAGVWRWHLLGGKGTEAEEKMGQKWVSFQLCLQESQEGNCRYRTLLIGLVGEEIFQGPSRRRHRVSCPESWVRTVPVAELFNSLVSEQKKCH
jgi:hypothetical protein